MSRDISSFAWNPVDSIFGIVSVVPEIDTSDIHPSDSIVNLLHS